MTTLAKPGGILKIVTEGQLQERDAEEAAASAISALDAGDEPIDALAKYVRDKFEIFRRHRTRTGLDDKFLHALRSYNGEYSPTKLNEIKQFGGSEVYSRITSVKCRGATALLRDVFLGGDKPWDIAPTPDPTTPDDISAGIEQLVAQEMEAMTQRGIPVDPTIMEQRRTQLFSAAKRASIKKAKEAAGRVSNKIDDLLTEGGFYKALTEFLIDLPIFPIAYIN